MKYDLLLQGGTVIDPLNGIDGVMDIGIKGGIIEACAEHLDPTAAAEVLPLSGKYVIPGMIDPHTHITSAECHKMLALAGVTTALDMSGPPEPLLRAASEGGCGLNLAYLDAQRVGDNVPSIDPSSEEIRPAMKNSLRIGALGTKILGGHFPMTPDSIARTIEIANEEKAYVAFHAGSTETGSNLNGALEAIRLAGSNRLHLCHINSYCRGRIKTPAEEALELISALNSHPNIRSESYLSVMNGVQATLKDGIPASSVLRTCLRTGGYPETEEGLTAAILEGWCRISIPVGGVNILHTGKTALDYWLANGKKASSSFPVNPPEARYLLAVSRRSGGSFTVDAFSTDGGTVPRLETLEKGLSLIRLQAVSWQDFVLKTSINPAKMLGLPNRGHLGEGAAADITVVDYDRQKAYATIVNGKIAMYAGLVTGKGTTMVTTEAGAGYIQDRYGMKTITVNTSESAFYKGL